MRILIDIGHPAHVHYFKHFIWHMQNKGHEIIITAREKDIALELLKKYNFKFANRGKGGKSLIGKIFYILYADWFILRIAIRHKPDLFLSFASTYAAHVAKLIRRPHIAFDDTEHAKFELFMYPPFTNVIITPNCFYKELGKKQIRFDGFIELCYLHPNRFKPNPDIKKILGVNDDEPYAIIRFVSWGASHDVGYHGFDEISKIKVIEELSKKIKLFISSEGTLPEKLKQFQIKISPDRMHDVLYYAKFFLGEGGTMASESSVLGTPAIYVNTLPLMGYLISDKEAGLLFHYHNADGVLEKAIEVLNTPDDVWKDCHEKLLKNKIDVTAFIVWFVENYPSSFRIMKENPDFQYNFK